MRMRMKSNEKIKKEQNSGKTKTTWPGGGGDWGSSQYQIYCIPQEQKVGADGKGAKTTKKCCFGPEGSEKKLKTIFKKVSAAPRHFSPSQATILLHNPFITVCLEPSCCPRVHGKFYCPIPVHCIAMQLLNELISSLEDVDKSGGWRSRLGEESLQHFKKNWFSDICDTLQVWT